MHCSVGDLTGTRRRYSKVRLPDRLARFVGADELTVEHFDDGISVNELPYWRALAAIKREEEKSRKGR